MPGDDDKRRQVLYDEHRKQTWQDIQTSTDDFDKNLLTFSSAALGFSVGFIKDIARLPSAVWHGVLYTSWISFSACIVITVFSFRLSAVALNKHLEYLREYYENKKEEYLTKKSTAGVLIDWCTWSAALFFLAGIVCTMIFCIRNVR